MPDKKNIYQITTISIVGISIIILVYSVWNFPFDKIDSHLIGFILAALFLGTHLHIQLPRTKIHITASDALTFFCLLVYSPSVAVVLSVLEALNGSFSLLSRGVPVKARTFAINASINAISAFTAGVCLELFLDEQPINSAVFETKTLIIILSILVISQFICDSLLVSFITYCKTKKSFFESWNEYSLNTLIVYITGAIISGLLYKAIQQVDLILLLITAIVAVVVFLTYKNYINDIKENAAKAEKAERLRAEQAENHVAELKHYISELEIAGLALQAREEQFRFVAFHDSLTELPNRNFLSKHLSDLLKNNALDKSANFAVLFLDLNRFKNINDSLGHTVGDLLLVNVARRLKNVIRNDDVVARFGGDEFAIVLNNIANIEQVIKLAERMQTTLSAPFILNGRRIFSSSSIGIAMSNSGYENVEDILRDADIAMYYAKEHGEGLAVFNQEMHTKAVSLMQTESDLRYALERREFFLTYQPIVELNSAELVGFEALIRWNHPTRGMVPPMEFIPLCEDTGLILPITFWVIREACEQIKKWHIKMPHNNSISVSVNISGKHFAESDLVEQIKQILTETGINPHCLKLEITESEVMANAENVIDMLKQLKALGLQLMIDDFGTGYSSLSYLHRFPTNTLKIDRSFVGKMDESNENCEIVKTILSLADTLNLSVIAEGIETSQQFGLLISLGCEYGQGYLFSRPLPANEAEALLVEKRNWKALLPIYSGNTATQHQITDITIDLPLIS
jgi:diguanylate cyclase (GGDEF)-like protein